MHSKTLIMSLAVTALIGAAACGRPGLAIDPNTTFLTLNAEGSGLIEGPDGIRCEADTCTFALQLGTVVTLTATAHDGAEFGGWWTDCTGEEPTCEVVMNHDRYARARFGFRAIVESIGSGSGRVVSDPGGIDCPGDCDAVFVDGTRVQLTATADDGSSIHSLSGACTGDDTCMFNINKSETVRALFYGGAPLWTKAFGGTSGVEDVTSNDHGYALGIGIAGQIHLAGAFRNTVDFGGTELVSAGGSDHYLVTLDRDGNVLSAVGGGDTANDGFLGLTMVSGDIYLAGYVTDPALGDLDSIVRRATPAASAWESRVETFGNDFAIGLARSGSEVAVAGQIGDNTANVDALFTGYALDGGAEGVRAAYGNGTQADIGYFAANDAQDNVITVGQYTGNATFGGPAHPPAGGLDGFIAKYDASRAFVWSQTIGGAGDDVVYAVGTDGMNVIVGGTFAGTVDFGGQSRTAVGSNDLFVARYSAQGTLEWVRAFGSDGVDEAYALAVDSDGSCVVTGYVGGPVDFGDGPLPYYGKLDVFVARFDAAGQHQWSYTYGGADDDVAFAVELRADGQPIIAGSFRATAVVGGTQLQSRGGSDILLMRAGR